MRMGDLRLMLPCGEAAPLSDLGHQASLTQRLGASLPPDMEPEDGNAAMMDFTAAVRGPTMCVLILGAFHASTLHPGGSADGNDPSGHMSVVEEHPQGTPRQLHASESLPDVEGTNLHVIAHKLVIRHACKHAIRTGSLACWPVQQLWGCCRCR